MLLLGVVYSPLTARSHTEKGIDLHKFTESNGSFSYGPSHPSVIDSILDGKQNHGLVQTFRLDCVFHEVRLGDDGRDGKADRDSHAAEGLRILREILVAVAHVARVEVRVWAHGREVQRVDARLREHQDADASGLSPDPIQIVPSCIARGAVSEEGLE